jgi:hypothetical protein
MHGKRVPARSGIARQSASVSCLASVLSGHSSCSLNDVTHFPHAPSFATAVLLCASALLPHAAAAQTSALSAGTSLVDTTQRVSSPFAASFPNACNGDLINFTGTLEVLLHYSENSNGTINLKQQDKIQGSGLGMATGHSYRVFELSNSEINGPKAGAGAQSTQTNTSNNDVNGPSQDDHFILQVKTHTVVKDGVPAVYFLDFKTCCPGSQDDTLTCQPVSMF